MGKLENYYHNFHVCGGMEDIKLFLGRMEDEGAIQNTLQYA